jgi:hypothetical protein
MAPQRPAASIAFGNSTPHLALELTPSGEGLCCSSSAEFLIASSAKSRRHLHKALKQLNYVNPFPGTHKAGNHAFRRFTNTYLRNHTDCPEGLYKYWLGQHRHDVARRGWLASS